MIKRTPTSAISFTSSVLASLLILVPFTSAAQNGQPVDLSTGEENGRREIPPPTGDPLAAAQAAYIEVDYERTLAYAQNALERGGYSSEQLERILALIAFASTATGNEEAARQTYIQLMAIDPDFQLGDDISPRFRPPYLEARGFWSAQSDHLGAEVIFVRTRGALRVDITDPLDMANRMTVMARLEGDLEFQEFNVPAEAQTYLDIEDGVGAQQVEYVLQVFDRHGNRLIEIGSEDVPEVLGEPAAPTPAGTTTTDGGGERRRGWLIAVAVIVTALVGGGVATGVVLGLQSGQVGFQTQVDLGLTD